MVVAAAGAAAGTPTTRRGWLRRRARSQLAGVTALLDDVLPAIKLLPVDVELHRSAVLQYRASLPTGVSFVGERGGRVAHTMRRTNDITCSTARDRAAVQHAATRRPQ